MKINEILDGLSTVQEAISENDLIKGVEQLKGEYFEGSLKSGLPDIDTSDMPENLYADFVATFENFKEDGFSVEDLKAYSHFIRDRKELTGKGYTLADWVHKDFPDDEIEEIYPDEDGHYWLFLNLTIKPDEFDGDFEKLSKEIDKYLLIFKERYEILKSGVSSEQKKRVKKLTNRTAGIKNAIPVIFKNGVVTEKEQTDHHYHATFSSNSTSHGLYVVEYPNVIKGQKGLTKEEIEQYMYLIQNNIVVPKPKAGMYSTIDGATKEFVMNMFKNGEYELDGNVIRLRDLPYEDVFIGD